MIAEPPVVFVGDDLSARESIQDLLQSMGLSAVSLGSAQDFLQGSRPDAPGGSELS
jgi:FixJ family two-component response regulator